VSVTQELARGGTRAFAVMEGLDTVNDDRMVALRILDPRPLATRQIMGNLSGPVGFYIKPIQIVDDDISCLTFTRHRCVSVQARDGEPLFNLTPHVSPSHIGQFWESRISRPWSARSCSKRLRAMVRSPMKNDVVPRQRDGGAALDLASGAA
jgi:hypothetical protein